MAARAARNGMLRPFLGGFGPVRIRSAPSPMCSRSSHDGFVAEDTGLLPALLRFVFKLMPGKMGDMRRGNGEEESPRTFVGGGFVHAAAAAAAAHATGIRCCRPCHWLLWLKAVLPTRDGLDEVQAGGQRQSARKVLDEPCLGSVRCGSGSQRRGYDAPDLALAAARALMSLPAYAAYYILANDDGGLVVPRNTRHLRDPGWQATRGSPAPDEKRRPTHSSSSSSSSRPRARALPYTFGGSSSAKRAAGIARLLLPAGESPSRRRRPGSPLQVHVVRRTAHSRSRRTRAGVLLATLPS
jgi:hypothetical protein